VGWYTEGGDKGQGVRGEREPPDFSNYFKHCIARLQSNVCERRGRSKNLALKACYV